MSIWLKCARYAIYRLLYFDLPLIPARVAKSILVVRETLLIPMRQMTIYDGEGLPNEPKPIGPTRLEITPESL